MALVLADRVNETTTTAGTGTLTLAGAVSGYQSFSVIGNANTTYYTIVHQTANEWEVGIGTYTSAGTTLSRDTVLASSAGGTTKVTFSAGTKFVFCDYPAGRAVYLDTASNATIPGITLSGGTANGVAYLNGSKVLTTGSALQFSGTYLQTLNGTGIQMQNAGATANWFFETSGLNLSFTSAQNGAAIWSINGSEQMRLTSTGLGIGTSSPSEKLSVAGNISADIYKLRSNTSAPASTDAFVFRPADNTLAFGTASSERARIDSSGNLGLGVTPSAWGSGYKAFQTTGTTLGSNSTNGTFYTQNAYFDGGNWIYVTTAAASRYQMFSGVHSWHTAASGTAGTAISSTQAMTLDTSGNLGIGTTSPFYKLSFAIGTNQVVGQYASSTHVAGNVGSLGIGINDGGGAASGVFVYNTHNGTYSSQDIRFLTAQGGVSVVTERMRIDPSGNVGIGTTSPSNPLTISSDTSAQVRINAISANINARLTLNASGTGLNVLGTTGTVPLAFLSGSTEQMRLDTSGNLGLGVAPSAWATYPALQVSKGSLWGPGSSFYLSANLYYDGTNRRYINSAYASEYEQASGQHIWLTAASGTAGAIVSLTQSMTLDASGNLGIGTTSPGNKLTVNGAASAVNLLQVTGTSGASQGILKAQAGSGATLGYNRSRLDLLSQAGTAGWSVYNYGDGGDLFAIAVYGGSDALNITQAGNVGIGTSSPSYKLDVNGAINTSADLVSQGSNARISLYRSTGINYFDWASGQSLYFSTQTSAGGAGRNTLMVLDSSGNLGIGTSSPGQKLTVQGGLNVTSSATLPVAQGSMLFSYESAVNRCYMGDGTGYSFAFSKRAASVTTDLMTLNDSGNLGIGTSSPGYKLQVSSGATAATSYFSSTATPSYSATAYNGGNARASFVGGSASGATTGINFSQGGSFEAYFGGVQESGGAAAFVWQGYSGSAYSERMRLDSSGNLGLGVTPSAWGAGFTALQVGSGLSPSLAYVDGWDAPLNAYYNGTNWIYRVTGYDASKYTQATGQHRWFTAPSGTAGNAISFTQAMTLDSSGNLLVGTTSISNLSTGAGVNVGFAVSDGQIRVQKNTDSNAYWSKASGYSSSVYHDFWVNGSNVGTISTSGTTTAYNTTSDQRLKENIADADSASDLIDAIKVRQFDWIGDGTHQRYGMVAQELVKVAPEAVHQPEDPERMMAVDYSKLVPMLIKEIQSLRQRVAQLEVK